MNEDQENNFNKEVYLRPLVLIGVVFIAIAALYFLVSPYQNCLRDSDRSSAVCTRFTAW